jgi:hypothetical protein
MKILKIISFVVVAKTLTLIGVDMALAQFYRQEGQPAVYYQYSDAHYCHVQNDA